MKNKRQQEYIQDGVSINEYEERPIYNENDSTADVMQAHGFHVVDIEQEQKENESAKGIKTAGTIIKAGKIKKGKRAGYIWLYYRMNNGAYAVTNYMPEMFLNMLNGINGIYADEIKDPDGFPICKDILLSDSELSDRLQGCRITFVDGREMDIRN